MELKREVYINNKLSTLATKRLISFELTDNIGLTLDNLKLTINNADKTIEIPSNNAVIELAIGFNDNLYKMGKFVAEYIDATSSIITINAVSQELSKGRARKNRVFKEKSLEDILKTLADDLDLTLQLDNALASKQIAYYIQDNKSGLEVLAELSEIFYALANIKDKNLVFVSKENTKNISIDEASIISIKLENTNAKIYGGVSYSSWNMMEAKLDEVKMGVEPYLLLQNRVDKSIENSYISSKYKEVQTSNVINMVLQGNPNLQAGFSFEISDTTYAEFKGKYRIEKVIHKYANTYVSNILATKIS